MRYVCLLGLVHRNCRCVLTRTCKTAAPFGAAAFKTAMNTRARTAGRASQTRDSREVTQAGVTNPAWVSGSLRC